MKPKRRHAWGVFRDAVFMAAFPTRWQAEEWRDGVVFDWSSHGQTTDHIHIRKVEIHYGARP